MRPPWTPTAKSGVRRLRIRGGPDEHAAARPSIRRSSESRKDRARVINAMRAAVTIHLAPLTTLPRWSARTGRRCTASRGVPSDDGTPTADGRRFPADRHRRDDAPVSGGPPSQPAGLIPATLGSGGSTTVFACWWALVCISTPRFTLRTQFQRAHHQPFRARNQNGHAPSGNDTAPRLRKTQIAPRSRARRNPDIDRLAACARPGAPLWRH